MPFWAQKFTDMGCDRKNVRLFPLLCLNLEVNVSGAHYPSPAHVLKLMTSCASHVYGPLVYILMPPPFRPPPRGGGGGRGGLAGSPGSHECEEST